MNFTWEDTTYYLDNYNKIRLDLNLFLATTLSVRDSDINVKESKTGNSNEKNLITKFTNEQYNKDSYALKCVDELYKEMDSREFKIMKNKYVLRLGNVENSIKVYCSRSTIDRTIYKQRKKLFEKLTRMTQKSVLK